MQLSCVKIFVMGIIRKTKSLTAVLNVFDDISDAISVVRLVELLKTEMNKTTVYRILDRLEEEGIIHSFNGQEGLKWYAKCKECTAHHHVDGHPHFQCTVCNKVECIDVSIEIPAIAKHKIDDVDILIKGKCEECYA